MSTENLDNTIEEGTIAEAPDTGTPEQSAPEDGSPDVSGDGGDSNKEPAEKSWAEVNQKWDGKDEEPESEIQALKRQVEEMKAQKETAEKRMSDTHRTHRTVTEEIKALREELAQYKSKGDTDETPIVKAEASRENTAPPAEDNKEGFNLEDYGLSDEEKELLEINPEMLTAFEKISLKKLESQIAQHEATKVKEQRDGKQKELEEQLRMKEEEIWKAEASKAHPDLNDILNSGQFGVWTESNQPVLKLVLADKAQYDPTGLIEVVDLYKRDLEKVSKAKESREGKRKSTVSHRSNSSPSTNNVSEKSWKEINAKWEKSRRS